MAVQLRKGYIFALFSVIIMLIIIYKWSRPHPLVGRAALDPELVTELRERLLRPPSSLPYNLTRPTTEDASVGQAQLVLEILGNKTGGTFVECGALDGETRSNTLFMERRLGWRGLLVEADPANYALLATRHRRAWSIPACLSGNAVSMVRFKQNFNKGQIDAGGSRRGGSYSSVLCVPLESMLAALGWGTVDYFSLDVEGHEFAVLKELPLERLDIRTLSVEFRHVPEGKAAIRRLMEARGYAVYAEITHYDDLANDFIFMKRSAFPELATRPHNVLIGPPAR